MSEWQPIETAPKDGKWVQLTDENDVAPGYWGNTYFGSDPNWIVYAYRSDWEGVHLQNPPTRWKPMSALPQRPGAAAMSAAKMTLGQAMEYAAQHLPGGAELQILIENGAATVDAFDWDGTHFDADSADMDLPEQILECVKWCIEQEPKEQP